jgi:UDP-N-acetylmuramoyl-L-alanyl-D-glutamate--2,6-diaminopimelate ligase
MQHLHTPQEAARWLHQRVSGRLCTDSRQVQAGDAFLAWPGAKHDARRHVADVLARGAAACLVEEGEEGAWVDGVEPALQATAASLAGYANLKAASGPIAAAYYEHPSQSMDVLAVTGTNGKTTTAWWLAQALTRLGHRCAVAGTLGLGEIEQDAQGRAVVTGQDTGLTTPDAVLWQSSLRALADRGVRACAVEASSIGLAEHRLNGTRIRAAIFTNLTQDHLDYHGDMAAYWEAKRALFQWQDLAIAVVNVDDPRGQALQQQFVLHSAAGQAAPDVWTCSTQGPARLWARDIQYGTVAGQNDAVGTAGLSFDLVESEQSIRVHTSLIGLYNVNNLLGVMATLRALGYTLSQAAQVCADLWPVPGRLQVVSDPNAPLVVVDYAHTPDALAQVLNALQPLAQARHGALVCVVGCGGDRDKAKRALMARAAEQHADRLVFTSDNPRSESPQAILDEMIGGLTQPHQVRIDLDRAQAIAHAVLQAAANDVVLIAGKGHESYQEVAGVRHAFSDEWQARQALQQRRAA